LVFTSVVQLLLAAPVGIYKCSTTVTSSSYWYLQV